MSFVGELKRRNVIRVAILYFVSSWLLLQLTDVLSSILPVPEWTGAFVFMMLLIGLAPALIFSWVYEMTSEGLKREKDIDRTASITPDTGKKINGVIVVLLLLAIVGMVVDRMLPEQEAQIEVAVEHGDAAVPRNSIAVLPFADLSAEGNQQFFTDGLSEELLNLLVRIDGLKVASRTSSFAYRESSLGIPEISGELGVAHILEGSVRKSGDRIRITAQLIEADTDRHLWSDNFDRELDDIFAIQDEIGKAIVNALKDELGILEEVSVNVTAVTSNVDAYELYLEARELFIRRVNLAESIRLYQEAIALDPGFAKAWEGLAAVEIVMDGWVFDDRVDHIPLGLAAARKALELDPNLSTAHAVIGDYYREREADKIEAMRNYDIALQIDPKNTTALLWRGIAERSMGFSNNAIGDFEDCLRIDPAYLNCSQFLAATYLNAGDYSRAIEIFEWTLEHNFHSMTSSFVPYYVKNGQRSFALALADISFYRSDAPVIEWIRAIESPEADHGVGIARWRQWDANTDSGIRFADSPEVLLAMGLIDEASKTEYVQHHLWHPDWGEFRSSPFFKEVVIDLGILAYWQEKGFPGFCRPVAADDFECDELH